MLSLNGCSDRGYELVEDLNVSDQIDETSPNRVSPPTPDSLQQACSPNRISPESTLMPNKLSPNVFSSFDTSRLELIESLVPKKFFYQYYLQNEDSECQNKKSPAQIIIERGARHLSRYVNVNYSYMYGHLCNLFSAFQLDEEVCIINKIYKGSITFFLNLIFFNKLNF